MAGLRLTLCAALAVGVAVAVMFTGCAVITPSDAVVSADKTTAMSASGAAPTDLRPAVSTITADKAREMMDKLDRYVLLDVRTPEEFAEKRIEGAVLIPDYEIADRAESELPDKEAVILVYCRSGRRSALAAAELAAMGYTAVYDFGGIMDWSYETVSG